MPCRTKHGANLHIYAGCKDYVAIFGGRNCEDVCFVLTERLQQGAVLPVPELQGACAVTADHCAIWQHHDGPNTELGANASTMSCYAPEQKLMGRVVCAWEMFQAMAGLRVAQ